MKKITISLKAIEPAFEKIEKLTKSQRVLIYAGAFLILIGVFVYFSYLPKFNAIDQKSQELETLEQQLALAKRQASQLGKFREEKRQAEEKFNLALKALPEKKEIPSLLGSISQSGQEAGLEFLLFQPGPEQPKDFYAEIPVSIRVAGNYHNVALFFDKVSRLSRLVNINNIQMAVPKEGGDLGTSCTAVTYMFVETPPQPPPAGKAPKK